MVEINFSGRQSDNFLCGFSPEENTQETLLSDLSLGLSLGSIYDGNFKERPFTRSFTGLINLNKGTVGLGNVLSLEMSRSIPIEGEQEQGRKSRGRIVGEEKSPEVTSWIVASAERNPALNRALAQIKVAEGCKFRKRLRIRTNRKGDSLMGESSVEHEEILFLRSSEKTKETQLSNQEQLECFDLNLTLSLSGINDDNVKEKPLVQSSSVSNLIDLTKDSDELSNTLSLARSCSILTEGEQDQRRAIKPRHFQIETHNSLEKHRSGAVNFGKEKVSLASAWLPPSPPSIIAPWAVSPVENNSALRRALSRIKEADGCVYRKRLRIAY
ncbi:uncharacterized protein LOC119987570 isoform X2 [Tripterygium wilfordii]|uniref:uncharacterized protein LOC119987570 isoform X2 n=1 Tax=Tripterygium wilfordii TaxID=458696 RepID=UPI0018F81881|nr:uncharacterized protein LOC119987570 isoform X2 [Tripterygium wilfordii]